MDETWIKIYRKFLEWEWYDDINTKCLFLHLLLTASNADKKWHGMTVQRGQVITSLDSLHEDLGLSVRQIRTSLEKLKSTGEVTSKATNKFRVITICKYDSYQDSKVYNDKQTDKQATSKRQADDKQATTSKEYKNIENINKENKKEKSDLPEFVEDAYKEIFSDWLQYKKEKRQTYKSEKSLKTCYDKLLKLSGNSPAVARQVVDQSIANNWSGLFEIKQNAQKTVGMILQNNTPDKYDNNKTKAW